MTPPTATAGRLPEPAFKLEVGPDQIAILTFDQPGSRANTLGQAVLEELEEILEQLAGAPTCTA